MRGDSEQRPSDNIGTEPDRVAEALRLSEQRLRLALDAAQMGLWDIDLATNVRSESDTMGPLFGRPVGHINSNVEAWKQHIHPGDLDRIVEEFSEAIQGSREYHTTYRILGEDGVTRWIESRGRVVRDAQGHPTRVVGVAFDITEARRAAAEREQLLLAEKVARQQAETASKSKDQFLAVLSHELRTPLTPVLTLAQMLQADTTLPESVRSIAATICRNVELEARLIDDLLDLTRISRGKLMLHLSDVNVHEKIQQVAQICQADLRGEHLELSMELNATNHFVRADSARLQQVLWNLLKNAIKFTPSGGRIRIATEETDGSMIVRVCDNGIGIRPEQLRTIFKPFEQGDVSTTRLFGGLGLGLTISNALAQAHGGQLEAASEGESKGSTFTLRLPALIAPALTAKTPASQQPAKLTETRRPRILLVEDHIDTGNALKRLLGNFGYDVRVATTVASALQVAHAERLDLLISDLGLPDGTGHDLMRQLLAKFAIRGIALSGYGMEEDVRKSHQSGFVEHLTKPIDLERLRSAIDRVMNGGDDITIPSAARV